MDSARGTQARRRSVWPRAVLVFLFVVLVVLLVVRPSSATGDAYESGLPFRFDKPPRPAEASTRRLLPEVVAGPSGDYEFIAGQLLSGDPVTYDPCRPIHLVVNYESAPPGAAQAVLSAVAKVRAATGLYLTVDGETDELATAKRPAVDIGRYGNRWSPVLIAFTTPERIPRLSGDIVGIGGSVPARTGLRRVYVTGIVYVDGPDLFNSVGSRFGYEEIEAVLLHELGHLVGLDHVDAVGELMNGDNTGLLEYGPGDLAGLAAVGGGTCATGL